jgi:uncharacterized protein (TIGR02246 family)
MILTAIGHRTARGNSPSWPFSNWPTGRKGEVFACRQSPRPVAEYVLSSLLTLALAAGTLTAAEAVPAARALDEAAIRAASKAYVEALDKGDAAKLAALWTSEGDIIDAAGNLLLGHEAVALDADADPASRPEFRFDKTRLRFLADDVAMEDGTVEVIPPQGSPLSGRFSATWVKHEGAWKLAALREARGDEPTAAAALAELDWMVGDWVVWDGPDGVSKPGRPVIEVSTRWNESRTYLVRVMTITHSADAPPLRITQRIGWDPLSKEIHSWAFGSDGSHGEAEWNRDGRSWVAQARAVMPNGAQSTSLNIYTYDGKNRCGWRSLPTHVGSEHVPAVNMIMIRKPKAGGDKSPENR